MLPWSRDQTLPKGDTAFKQQKLGEENMPALLTKTSITGLVPVAEPRVRGPPCQPLSRVQGTGFGDGGYEVLVISIAPAPPADLRLTAARNHRPVAQMSGREIKEAH